MYMNIAIVTMHIELFTKQWHIKIQNNQKPRYSNLNKNFDT